jgi:hypothetical protein
MVAIKSGVQNEKGVVLASPGVLGTFDATATIFRKKRCGERYIMSFCGYNIHPNIHLCMSPGCDSNSDELGTSEVGGAARRAKIGSCEEKFAQHT